MRGNRGREADSGLGSHAGHVGIKGRNLQNREKEKFGRQNGQTCI